MCWFLKLNSFFWGGGESFHLYKARMPEVSLVFALPLKCPIVTLLLCSRSCHICAVIFSRSRLSQYKKQGRTKVQVTLLFSCLRMCFLDWDIMSKCHILCAHECRVRINLLWPCTFAIVMRYFPVQTPLTISEIIYIVHQYCVPFS